MIASFARMAAEKGILMMVVCERLGHDEIKADEGGGLWFSDDLSEDDVKRAWRIISGALCEEWNVVGVDLLHQPYAASWGKGLITDWDRASARIGNSVLHSCPRWLVAVTGVGTTPGAPGADDTDDEEEPFFKGENLVGVAVSQVDLNNPMKLLYSAHVLGPDAEMQGYFTDHPFP